LGDSGADWRRAPKQRAKGIDIEKSQGNDSESGYLVKEEFEFQESHLEGAGEGGMEVGVKLVGENCG
jgi:hypothetical protein